MQKLLETCRRLGLDKESQRADRLKSSIPALQSENVLFFICGCDFVYHPGDRKFEGIEALFVNRGGKFELNLYPNCLEEFHKTLSGGPVSASIEGTSVADQPGKQFTFDPAKMQRQAGVRPGGAANYNLQTKALDVLLTHGHGLDKDGALETEIIGKLQGAFAKPVPPVTPLMTFTLDEMRQYLTPYWGPALTPLGL